MTKILSISRKKTTQEESKSEVKKEFVEKKLAEMEAKDENLKNLVKEYQL